MAPPPLPIIDGLAGKIATLERRREHLERRLHGASRGASADFDKAEESALRAAVKAMEYVNAVRGAA